MNSQLEAGLLMNMPGHANQRLPKALINFKLKKLSLQTALEAMRLDSEDSPQTSPDLLKEHGSFRNTRRQSLPPSTPGVIISLNAMQPQQS